MTRYWFVFLLLCSLFWDLATKLESAEAAQMAAARATDSREATDSDQNHQVKRPQVAPDTLVITINGLCKNSMIDNTVKPSCKTMITQAQFVKVIEAIQPNMPERARRNFALRYTDALVMAKKAEQMGLDKGTNYEDQMKLARIQILSKELNKAIQKKASQISYKDIEDYYKKNIARFEKAEMDRIYVPKSRQLSAPPSDKRSDDANRQEPSQKSGQMKEVAEILRARAVAGEEFSELQAEAYQMAGIRSAVPQTSIKIARTSLPSDQVFVIDLKPGEVSPVLADPSGYIIYRVKTKDTLPLDQAGDEIKEILRSQRTQAEISGIQDSVAVTLNNSYFPSGEPDR